MGYEAAATTLEQGKPDGGVDGAGREVGRQVGCVELLLCRMAAVDYLPLHRTQTSISTCY